MRQPFKRILSAVLVMVLCISLLSGLSFAATVNYKTGNPEGFQNVILNWGQRGTTATFLSPNAISFYEDNGVTYSQLSALTGASNVSATPGSQLYKTLKSLMAENHDVITSYGDTRPLYSYTDCQNSTRSELTCFYSGVKIGPDWDSGKTWNREHTWPNSKGMEGSDEDDIMMLRPTSSSVNSSRGNNAYGASSGYYDPNKTSGGKYDLHGDVARIFLYVYVRWGNTANPWGTDGVIESKDVLLQWMREDPVDTWEMGRNDSVESITGTRNVFVDYPELAFALFDAAVPQMVTPSGEAMRSTYNITVQSNNNAWGSASLSGLNINASPATGYRVAGYTLLEGTATVRRNGNTFAIEPSSDCVIQINFEQRNEDTVCFVENGAVVSSDTYYTDDTYTLPTHSGEVPEGYSFQGWVTSELTETTAKPAQILAPGKVLTAAGDITYYALYSRLDTAGSGTSSAFELFSGKLEAGNYLITHNNGALAASVSDKGRLNYLDVIPVGNAIDEPAESIIWEIRFTDDGYVTLYNRSAGVYAAGTGIANKAKVLTTVTDFAKWTPSGEAEYEFINLGNANKGVNNLLRRNTTFGFACYSNSTGSALTLYKQATGTVYYCTSAQVCEHVNTKTVEALAATCTEDGYTEGVYCQDCSSYISGHQTVTALGHDYESELTPPVDTAPGYTTYTCAVCGDSYRSGDQYLVSFKVPGSVEKIESLICDEKGIILPTPQEPENYRFVGWATEQVEKATAAPATLKGSYIAKANITLYALYSYTEGVTEINGWHQVTNAANLSVGDSVVLASNQKGKVATEIYSQYLTDVNAVFSADLTSITQLPESAIIFTLGKAEDGNWTLTNQAGQQLCSSALKKLNWDRGINTWTISIDEAGLATVSNTNESYGYFMYNVNSPRFTTYTSNPTVSMLMPQLYKLEGSMGTTYFTTQIGSDEPAGSLTGSISTQGDVTLELSQDGVAISTVTASGSYSFDAVAPGAYTLTVSKENHVTRRYTVTVEDGAAVLDVKLHLIGDIDGNGKINVGDVAKVNGHIKNTAPLTDEYQLLCANVNGGSLNMGDTASLYAHIKGTKKLY